MRGGLQLMRSFDRCTPPINSCGNVLQTRSAELEIGALPRLKSALNDIDDDVRKTVEEALEKIK